MIDYIKASELVEMLQEAIELHGDLDVVCDDDKKPEAVVRKFNHIVIVHICED